MFDWSNAGLSLLDAAPKDNKRIELGQLNWHDGTVTCTATCWMRTASGSVTFVFPFARLAQVITYEPDFLGLAAHVAPLRQVLLEVSRSPILKSWSESESLIEHDTHRNPGIVRHFAILSGESTLHAIAPDSPVGVSEHAA